MRVIRTVDRKNERWHEGPPIEFTGDYNPSNPVIVVDTKTKGQVYMGFGGAFTEAAASTFFEMDESLRNEFMTAYFDKDKGLAYVLGRTHINSSDFSLGNYTYIEEGDASLKTFDISREDRWVIPMIQAAEAVAGHSLKILSSPWSPPAFMKSNNEMNYGGKLLEAYADAWANYYVAYVKAMKDRHINIWGLTVQNEPQALQVWDSCLYMPCDERDFIKNHLGPTLEKNKMEDLALLICDHNRDIVVDHASTVLSDPEAAKYVWGTANHWYVSEAFENLSVVHHMFPDKHILFTESCVELTNIATDTTGKKGYIGSWTNGETYGRNIIGDFNNWSEGWIDWNLLLNEMGGPNHVENYCEAPIMYDRDKKALMYNPSYYYIGHFSRYIQVGAQRLTTLSNGNQIHAVSFLNPDGSKVVVVQNEGFIQEMALVIDGKGVNITLPDRSITTYIL